MSVLSPKPDIAVRRVRLEAILRLRDEYRREMNCQIVHDSWHARGFTDSYLLTIGEESAGYAAVGGNPGEPKTIIKEFFLLPSYRASALQFFKVLIAVSGAQMIEAQTNDPLLSLMLYDFAVDLTSNIILFADGLTTNLTLPNAQFRRMTKNDHANVFPHTLEPVGDWGLESDRRIIATGGVLFHYNPPFGDIYLEVDQQYRRRGCGSYIVQELKRVCRETGHIPAARCRASNVASRFALQRGGMFPCARILRGRIVT